MKSSDNPSLASTRAPLALQSQKVGADVASNFVNFLSGRTKSCHLLLLALLVSFAAFLSACGGGGNNNVTPAISVALSSPPTSVQAGATAQFTAVVTNDSANAGVNWTCAPAGSCGSFNPTKTASGAATTYTAPATAPSGGSVTVTATSASDGTKTASASVTIATATGISVTIATPPTSLQVGATSMLTATVTGDSSNGGVNWSCAPASSCGTFAPAQTASGTATTYTAPATVPTGGTVTVTATSVTDSTKSANATITISTSGGGGSASLAAGTYVFLVTGLDHTSHVFGLAGEVQLDGNGNVTAGEQDYSNGNGLNSNGATPDTISAGTYTANSTGQGTLTLTTSNTNLGANGTETMSITVVNSKHVLITEFDSGATASGTLDMQNVPASGLTTGGWSFEDVGENNHASYSQGGVFTLNAASQAAICPTTTTPCSPLSSIVTDFDEIASGTRNIVIGDGNGSGYFSAADANGRGQAFFGGIYWDYYIVGPEVVRMLGYFPQTGTFDQLYVGSAYGQGTATFSASSFTGTFAFTDASTVLSTTYAAAGLMKFDGSGTITGFADVSEGTATPTSGAIGGTYQMNIIPSTGITTAVNGYGRITISSGSTQGIATIGMYAVDPTLNISDPNNTTSTGQGALLVDLDSTVNGDGVLLTQNSTSGVAAGNYAVGAQVFTATNGEVDLVGQAAANASAVFTGTVDVNSDDATLGTGQTPAASFSVTLSADGSNPGRFTAPLSLTIGGNPQSFNLVFYQVSGSQFIMLVSGAGASGTGTVQSQ